MILSGRGGHKTPIAGTDQANTERKEQNAFRMRSDEINKMYNSTRWHKFRAVMINRNPICQRLLKNPMTGSLEQCHEKSVVAHHQISPRVRKDLFLVSTNILCFCEGCHPAGIEGNPRGWQVGVHFVPTNLPKFSF